MSNFAQVSEWLKQMTNELKEDNDRYERKLRYIDVDYADNTFAVEITHDKITGIFCDGDLSYLLKPVIEEAIRVRTFKNN